MAQTQIHGSQQVLDNTIKDVDIDSTAAIQLNKLEKAVISADGATAHAANQSFGGFKITNLGTPVAGTDASTKDYVDSLSQGINWKAPVRVASTANLTLSGTQTIDGVGVIAGDRVLAKNQTTGSENGIYVVAAGAWARATDADAAAELKAAAVFSAEGTVNSDSAFVQTVDTAITVGTTALVFVQFTGLGQITAGNGLTKTANTLDVVAGDSSIIVNADEIHVNYARQIKNETPAGAVNGTNTIFTLANAPIAGKEEVHYNGILQDPGSGNDYTISGATITFGIAPIAGKIRVHYIY